MPLNKSHVGKPYPPITTEVTLDAIQKYARAYNDDNPAFFDTNRPAGIVAPPMFAVAGTACQPGLLAGVVDGKLVVPAIREFFMPERVREANGQP